LHLALLLDVLGEGFISLLDLLVAAHLERQQVVALLLGGWDVHHRCLIDLVVNYRVGEGLSVVPLATGLTHLGVWLRLLLLSLHCLFDWGFNLQHASHWRLLRVVSIGQRCGLRGDVQSLVLAWCQLIVVFVWCHLIIIDLIWGDLITVDIENSLNWRLQVNVQTVVWIIINSVVTVWSDLGSRLIWSLLHVDRHLTVLGDAVRCQPLILIVDQLFLLFKHDFIKLFGALWGRLLTFLGPFGNWCLLGVSIGCNRRLVETGGRALPQNLPAPTLGSLSALGRSFAPLRMVVVDVPGLSDVDQLMLASGEENVPDHGVTQVHNVVKVSLAHVFGQSLILGLETKILMLYLDKLGQMVLELVVLQLLQIVLTQNHVLDQLCDFLVQLNDIWFPVDEVLDGLPVQEVGLHLLRASTERTHKLAQELRGFESRWRWLLDSENV
jgi:hypothetical protein